ncbi:MAG: hypothetical protein ACYC27_23045 [Armatimonadota bacterium]
MKLSLSPVKIAKNLMIIVLVLSALSLTIQLIRVFTGHGRLFGLGSLFNTGTESNIPTWYSTMSLMFSSVLLWIIAIVEKERRNRFARHWKYLSYIFLYLSLDEACMLHERLGDLTSSIFQGTPLSKIGWVAPFGIIVIIIGLSFIQFIRSLPAPTKKLFILSGVMYAGGAAVLEVINGLWRMGHEGFTLFSALETSAEELLEMSGIVLFIYALTSYIVKYVDDLAITFEDEQVIESETDPHQVPNTAYPEQAE